MNFGLLFPDDGDEHLFILFQIHKSPLHFQRCWPHTPISILRTKPCRVCGSGELIVHIMVSRRQFETPLLYHWLHIH